MEKGIVLGVVFLLVVMSFTSISGIQIDKNIIIPSGRGDILYVGGSGPGNYTSIQDAIDDASDGDTVFVFNGTYNVRVNFQYGLVVDKSVNLIGEDKNNTFINGSGCRYIIDVTANNTNISGFTISNGKFGIYSWYRRNLNISMNIFQTEQGVHIFSQKPTFSIIKNNVFKKNIIGIYVSTYSSNIISRNIFDSPKIIGIEIDGSYNIVTGNIFVNYDGFSLNEHIRMDYTDNSTICDNTFINLAGNDSIAINLYQKNDFNVISNNTISGYSKGIFIKEQSRFNEIVSNQISNNDIGIDIKFASHYNNILSNNFINNTKHACFGLYSFSNKWDENYWSRPRLVPYIIFGKLGFIIPWINIDWHPAKEPYNMTSTQGCGIE